MTEYLNDFNDSNDNSNDSNDDSNGSNDDSNDGSNDSMTQWLCFHLLKYFLICFNLQIKKNKSKL